MDTKFRRGIGRFLGNRAAVVTAGTIGFLIGATGLVAAQQGADDSTPVTTVAGTDTTVSTTATVGDDSTPTSSVATTEVTAITIDLTIPDPIDDSSTSIAGTADASSTSASTNPSTSVAASGAGSSSSLPGPSTSVSGTVAGSSTSLPGPSTTIDDDDDDDDITSTSVPRTLPAAFTETYRSNGGSITVSWSGAAFSINSINPAAGFVAEIEDNSWDRIRVDFEHDDDDARIEVRLHDGTIRVRID